MEYSIRELSEFDICSALKEHLLELEKQRNRTDQLIANIRQTIALMEGECEMSDKERFAAFKEEMIAENEKKYGAEIRGKYGDDAVDASNRKMLNMTEKEYNRNVDGCAELLCAAIQHNCK